MRSTVQSHILLIFFLTCCGVIPLAAQNSIEFEQQTQNLYEQKRWEDLVRLASEALAKGNETYAIRYRYAVALLETGRWNQADEALKKLVVINPFDLYSEQLLVNHYIKTGRTLHADLLRKGSIPIQIGLQYGRSVPDVDDIGVMNYVDATFSHRLFRGSQLTWLLGSLNQPVYWGEISQVNAYLRYDQALADDWSISTGANVLDFSKGLSDTLGFGGRSLVLGAEISKRISALSLSASASTSNLYARRQWQTGIGLSAYPGRYASWMLQVQPLMIIDENEQKIGLNSSVHWYSSSGTEIALSFYAGDAQNHTEKTVYIVHNSLDLTKQKFGLYLQRDIAPNLQAYLLYQYVSKQERFFGFDYNTQQLFTGLSIRL